VLVCVANEHPAIKAGAGALEAGVVRLYGVIVTYTSMSMPDNFFKLKETPIQGYSGVFLLQEVTDLRVVIRQPRKSSDEKKPLGPPTFIPWRAVPEIQSFQGL
jgi:hypothetical protein